MRFELKKDQVMGGLIMDHGLLKVMAGFESSQNVQHLLLNFILTGSNLCHNNCQIGSTTIQKDFCHFIEHSQMGRTHFPIHPQSGLIYSTHLII